MRTRAVACLLALLAVAALLGWIVLREGPAALPPTGPEASADALPPAPSSAAVATEAERLPVAADSAPTGYWIAGKVTVPALAGNVTLRVHVYTADLRSAGHAFQVVDATEVRVDISHLIAAAGGADGADSIWVTALHPQCAEKTVKLAGRAFEIAADGRRLYRVDLQLVTGCFLVGRVLAPDGAREPGASVVAHPLVDGVPHPWSATKIPVRQDGSFRLAVEPFQEYAVTAIQRNCPLTTARANASRLGDNPVAPLLLTVGHEIVGSLDLGQLDLDVVVTATCTQSTPTTCLRTIWIDDRTCTMAWQVDGFRWQVKPGQILGNGRYEITGLQGGPYRVEAKVVSRPGDVLLREVTSGVDAIAPANEVNLRLAAAMVVLQYAGKPVVPKGHLVVESADGDRSGSRVAGGPVRLVGPPGLTFHLAYSRLHQHVFHADLVFPGAGQSMDCLVRDSPDGRAAAVIEFVVTGLEGAGVGIAMTLRSPPDVTPAQELERRVVLDHEGRARVEPLPAGRWQLRVGGAPAGSVLDPDEIDLELTAGATQTVSLTVRRGARVRLSYEQGSAARIGSISLVRIAAGGQPRPRQLEMSFPYGGGRGITYGPLAHSGDYESAAMLAPGEYEVRIRRSAAEPQRCRFVVREGVDVQIVSNDAGCTVR